MEFAAFVLWLLVAPSLLNTENPAQEKKTHFLSLCVHECVPVCVHTNTQFHSLYAIRKSEASVKGLPLSLLLMVLRQCLSLSLELILLNRLATEPPGTSPISAQHGDYRDELQTQLLPWVLRAELRSSNAVASREPAELTPSPRNTLWFLLTLAPLFVGTDD